MVRTKDELLSMVQGRIGEDNSDDALAFIEDIKDTLDDYDTKVAGDGTDWKSKYEENDASWREKYKARFFSTDAIPEKEKETETEEESKTLTYDELFKEG